MPAHSHMKLYVCQDCLPQTMHACGQIGLSSAPQCPKQPKEHKRAPATAHACLPTSPRKTTCEAIAPQVLSAASSLDSVAPSPPPSNLLGGCVCMRAHPARAHSFLSAGIYTAVFSACCRRTLQRRGSLAAQGGTSRLDGGIVQRVVMRGPVAFLAGAQSVRSVQPLRRRPPTSMPAGAALGPGIAPAVPACWMWSACNNRKE
jgi:hypothetical protein